MASPSPTTLTTKLVRVAHLSGTSVSYHLFKPLVGSKPTLVLIPSLLATASTLIKQVSDKILQENVNLLVLEPLGHGATKVVGLDNPSFTIWDSATIFLQAMEALNVKKAFVLGVSQGGMIATRMALYAPERIMGIITVGSIQDTPAPETVASMLPIVTQLTAGPANPEFKTPEEVLVGAAQRTIQPGASDEDVKLWSEWMAKVYVGEAGRVKLRQSVLSQITRDGLYLRLAGLKKKPFLTIRGSEDPWFTKQVVEKEVETLREAGLEVQAAEVEGAGHAATWSHPDKVNELVLAFIKKYGGKVDARALREAVGMVDI